MQQLRFYAQFARGNLQEMARQAGNIFPTLAQWRQMNADNVQAVEQILTELAFLYPLFEILMGRSDNPHIHFHRRIAANAIKLTVCQHAQQTRLYIERHIANFIEE